MHFLQQILPAAKVVRGRFAQQCTSAELDRNAVGPIL
jgi:hypothetical protein